MGSNRASSDLSPGCAKVSEAGSQRTLCWKEMDSNHRSLATSPALSHAPIDVAARHYEGHALEHRHVVKRTRIHSDHIGRFARRDRPNFVGNVKQLGCVDRRFLDRLAGMHSPFDHEVELTCVLSVGPYTHVRAEGSAAPSWSRAMASAVARAKVPPVRSPSA